MLSFYIGDLYLGYSIMTIDNNNEKVSEFIELKQRKRELKITITYFYYLINT